jgi:hypothetical protein
VEQHDYDKSRTLFEIHGELSQNSHRFWKKLSQQKSFVLQSTAQLQLKRFKSWQQNGDSGIRPSVAKPEKKQCCKIARFTDAPCIIINMVRTKGETYR